MKYVKNGVEIEVEITKVPKTHKENLLEKKTKKIINQREEIKKLLGKNWQLETRIGRIKHYLNHECKNI